MTYAKKYVNQPLQRVNRHQPCPICGKTDWCSFNDRIAICMRIESNHPVSGKMGGWLHKLTATPIYYRPVDRVERAAAKAPIEVCDRVYRSMLDLLSLEYHHIKELKRRGLTVEEVEKAGFRSLTGIKPWEVCQRLINMGHNLKGVPGFYQAPNKKGNGYYWCFNYSPGFVFPILNSTGKIQALQIRLDKHVERRKYQIFSSGNKQSGACSGVPVHVARPQVIKDSRIWVTEGALKATILSQKIGAVVLGTVSANTWSEAVEVLQRDFPDHEVVEAFDQDKYTNLHVRRACEEFRKAVAGTGRRLCEALWYKKFKGADDAAVAGCKFLFRKIS
ncbi:DUF3854 domain-containing protein [Desulfotomaculum nigrificans]|uniref:DUF3854 domain-containing protein n=1 Tax=Desulfotomaculum nigrificans TaxID=1565 RepID=UPI0001FAE5B8|nr:DUF3854 domain-containing protein [Desulfotomaculum nigrificans]